MTSGRTSCVPSDTRSAVPIENTAERANTPETDQPAPSMSTAASTGPTANPTGPAAPNSAIDVPTRWRGTTSRMPASITPVFPSWNPISSTATAICHGSRASAASPNTTTSTRQLRTMTTLRLYLSAQTPQSGTSGSPRTKTSEPNRPMNGRRSVSGTPSSRR